MNINIVHKIAQTFAPTAKAALKTAAPVSAGLAGAHKISGSLNALANQNITAVQKTTVNKQAIADKIKLLEQQASQIYEESFVFKDGTEAIFTVFQGTKAGTNKGFFVKNKETGELFYAKFGKKAQSQEEVLASNIYKLLGLDVPKMQLIKNSDGQIGLLSKFIPNLKPVTEANHAVTEGFGADVLLGNWDAVISDNIQTNGQKLFRIDFGGALNYRAQGEDKKLGIIADELTTMLDPMINPSSALMFSKMTTKELIKSLEKVSSLDEAKLCRLLDDESLKQTLLKRKEFLTYALEIIKKTPKENQTMLEYLESIKKCVLTTPLTEFETYRLKHPEAQEKGVVKKLTKQLRTQFAPNQKEYSKIAENMLQQRTALDKRTSKALRNNGYPTIEEELMCVKNSFGDMNRNIRWGQIDSSVTDMDTIIKRLCVPCDTTLYRAGTAHDFGGLCSSINTDKFLDTFYKKGRYYTIPIFPNATFNRKIAEDYLNIEGAKRFLYKINAPKGTPAAYMEKLPGSTIETNEEEVLLARNLIYQFKSRTPYFTHDEIEVNIVNKLPKGAKVHNFTKEVQTIKDRGLWNRFFK